MKENEKLKEQQAINDLLRQEKDQLQKDNQAPISQAIKQIPESVELEKAKEYYTTKNKEIELLIKQVM